MRAISNRVGKLEGIALGATWVGVSVPYYWEAERKLEEATALALAAGTQPPFFFIFVAEHFGPGGPTEARLISIDGRMCE